MKFLPLLALWLSGSSLVYGQKITIPATMPIAVQLIRHVPMKTGEPIQVRLLYPIYADNKLAIPAGSTMQGSIVSLSPDKSRRLQGRRRGDFTPFHTPVVQFRQLTLPDGEELAITTDDATGGAPILHLTAPSAHKRRAFIAAQFAQARQRARDEAALFTSPGRGDRIVQFLYRQLPYHPERIDTGTAWTVNLTTPLAVTPQTVLASRAEAVPGRKKERARKAQAANQPVVAKSADPSALLLDAYLTTTISSAHDKVGDKFQAYVTQPVYGPGHTLTVPEGALLIGTITQAKHARSFGRRGKLRFSFRELKMPNGGAARPVEGTLTAADASSSSGLKLDAEGGVQPQQQDRVIVPLVLGVLAGHAFDDDGNVAGNSAVASNGFGVVGRITGIVAGSRDLAAGIGFYAAALAVYSRWIARGKDVTFTANTRIEVVTTPSRTRLGEAATAR